MRSMRRSLCATMLTLQAVVLGLTTPVLISITDVGVATALWVGLGLAVTSLLAAGLLRHRWAYGLGWLVQLASLALGFLIPMMFVLGVVFTALWATAYFMGDRIDRERAERAGLEQPLG